MNARITVGLSLVLLGSNANAQAREPLCRTTLTRRVASERVAAANLGEPVYVAPILGRASDNARFVVLWRNADRAGRGVSLRFARVDEELRRVGPIGSIAHSGFAQDQGAGAIAIASLPGATLVLFRSGQSFYRSTIDAMGVASAARELFSLAGEVEGSPNRVAWATAIERDQGAVALAGGLDGSVRALRFDARGEVSTDATWTQRVGGTMRLLPTTGGPIGAFLHRPLPGVGPYGDQPALQMLVTLDNNLMPIGTPERSGFAQFPWAATRRPNAVEVLQWSGGDGVAIGRLPVTARRLNVETPRLWYAQPPFVGRAEYAASLTTSEGITYGLMITGGALVESHLAWVAPSGQPALRHNVVPVFGTVIAEPALARAEDGFVAFVAQNDETGFALDAHHVRCELVRRSED